MLHDLGLLFQVDPPHLDETPKRHESARHYVARIAHEKAVAVAARNPGAVVLAADTTVTASRRIFGKPESRAEATQMLEALSGRRHRVLTAIAVVDADGSVYEDMTDTLVKMRPLSPHFIECYTAREENWRGVAGAYKLQDAWGGALVARVNGSVSGVIGLPLVETLKLLRRCGFDL